MSPDDFFCRTNEEELVWNKYGVPEYLLCTSALLVPTTYYLLTSKYF